ncbi:hypothetical protein Pint_10760 [Pistacia integerrima]|uniref:Uncharacterized protein n=1 Tax=Pistacia integerrima TaxID=434235 RepID=A0ACC0XHR9_9ROSI|nr:hypothetical protein Pint_10760 [Pistacia integerrima]
MNMLTSLVHILGFACTRITRRSCIRVRVDQLIWTELKFGRLSIHACC